MISIKNDEIKIIIEVYNRFKSIFGHVKTIRVFFLGGGAVVVALW